MLIMHFKGFDFSCLDDSFPYLNVKLATWDD